MQLNRYYSEQDHRISFSREQASRFAKEVAGDFNPIHDHDAKRFCVPGDLLFALVLNKYGLNRDMRFTFSGMVGDNTPLAFPDSSASPLTIADDQGKEYLTIERQGEISTDQDLILDLTRHYVEFSGQTFPHILVPLMTEKQVMINTDRPLVIYESMIINMQRLDISEVALALSDSALSTDGKRGNVRLAFDLITDGEIVGSGEKNIVLSGLRPYEQDKIDALVNNYNARKEALA